MSRRVKSRSAPRARSMSGAIARMWSPANAARSSKRPEPAGVRRSGLGKEAVTSGVGWCLPAAAGGKTDQQQEESQQQQEAKQQPQVEAGAVALARERRGGDKSGAREIARALVAGLGGRAAGCVHA